MAEFGPLVTADWLSEHLDDVRVVDVRWYLTPQDGRTGRIAYAEGHLPGAVFLDIDTDLAGPASAADGRHPLPTPEHFAAVLSRAGIAPDTRVVAYDDSGGSTAARLWWMLHVLGQPAAVLDGGMAAWPGPLSTDVADVPVVECPPRPWPDEPFVSAEQVAAAGNLGAAVLDARTFERFVAGNPAVDPQPGHIPGARSAAWAGNLGADGRFLAVEQLRERYREVLDADTVIAYCGSGVTSCHTLIALEVAGRSDGVALYPGSWSQWANDPARAAEPGPGRRPPL